MFTSSVALYPSLWLYFLKIANFAQKHMEITQKCVLGDFEQVWPNIPIFGPCVKNLKLLKIIWKSYRNMF